ncbi:MAG: dephospho-CoA kinase [candidate division Zixibacteria bacterium]|nr:dephospho-CoA kinase [candidate division Zixibacteria bacterium]
MRPSGTSGRRIPVIGITGGVGAGKSEVADLFVRWGGVMVSGDEIGKQVVDRSRQLRGKLVKGFGRDIIRGGRIVRARLAEKAFSSRQSTARLNRLVHPYLLRELNRQISRARRVPGCQAVIVDAALLAEWGRRRVRWDTLVGVWAPLTVRRRRLRKRGWDDRQINGRIRAQMSWRARRQMADYVVKNDGSLAALERRARFCWGKIISCD